MPDFIYNFEILYVLLGAFIGAIVGLSGVGAAAILTPTLMFLGINPIVAITTDLCFSFLTKFSAAVEYLRKNRYDAKTLLFMLSGSLTGIIVSFVFDYFSKTKLMSLVQVNHALGVLLFITALVILGKNKIVELETTKNILLKIPKQVTWVSSVLLGIAIYFTSVGAGALGALIIFMISPEISMIKLVGTDILHAIPLTAFAGIFKIASNHKNLDVSLLCNLLIGSIPAIRIASLFADKAPVTLIRNLVAICVMAAALKLFFK